MLVFNQPLPIHAAVQARLIGALQAWATSAPGRGLVLLSTSVVMDDYNVYGPDARWLSEEHKPTDLYQRLPRTPDLCAEVRSPSTWRFEIGAKKRVYEDGGLPELWLVDRARPRRHAHLAAAARLRSHAGRVVYVLSE